MYLILKFKQTYWDILVFDKFDQIGQNDRGNFIIAVSEKQTQTLIEMDTVNANFRFRLP